jgi:hypothetical protein
MWMSVFHKNIYFLYHHSLNDLNVTKEAVCPTKKFVTASQITRCNASNQSNITFNTDTSLHFVIMFTSTHNIKMI